MTWYTLAEAAERLGLSERTLRGRVRLQPPDLAQRVAYRDDPRVGRKGGWVVSPQGLDLLRNRTTERTTEPDNGTSVVRPEPPRPVVTAGSGPWVKGHTTAFQELGIAGDVRITVTGHGLVLIANVHETLTGNLVPKPSPWKRVAVASEVLRHVAALLRAASGSAEPARVVRQAEKWIIQAGRIRDRSVIRLRGGGVSVAERSGGILARPHDPRHGAVVAMTREAAAALAGVLET